VIGARETVAGWAGIGAGGAFVVTAASLLTRTLRPTLEARAYAHDIRRATDGAVENLRALSRLEQTREVSARLAEALQPPRATQR
jgi:hypothetical protein